MDRHRNGASIAAALIVVSVFAGCSFERSLPTHNRAFHEGAGFDGILHVDGGWVWVEGTNVEIDKEAFNVLWPAGYGAQDEPLEIIDARGEILARNGDAVSFGVGDMVHVDIPGCPVRPVLLATEIVAVNEQPLISPTPFLDRPVLHQERRRQTARSWVPFASHDPD